MKILTIESNRHIVELKLKGLSIKACSKTRTLGHDLCRFDFKSGYYLSTMHIINGNTAQIDKKHLIEYLKELYSVIPFDKIKISGYELTGEELMNEILK